MIFPFVVSLVILRDFEPSWFYIFLTTKTQ